MSDAPTEPLNLTSPKDIIKHLARLPIAYSFSDQETSVIKAACSALNSVSRPAASPESPSSIDDVLKAMFPNWQTFDSMQACISATLTELRRSARSGPAEGATAPVQLVKPLVGSHDLITVLINQFLPRVKKAKRPMNMGLNGVPVSETPNVASYYRVCPDGTVERWDRLRNKPQYVIMGTFKLEGYDGDDEDDNPNAPRFTPGSARALIRGSREE